MKFEDYDIDALVPDRVVREHYGNVTQMTIWRWDQNPSLGFPKPVVINNRKYRPKRKLLAFDATRPDRGTVFARPQAAA